MNRFPPSPPFRLLAAIMAMLMLLTGCAPSISKDWLMKPDDPDPCAKLFDLAEGREVVLYLVDGSEAEGIYEGCDSVGVRILEAGTDPLRTVPWTEIERVGRKANAVERGSVITLQVVFITTIVLGIALAIALLDSDGRIGIGGS